MTDQRSGMRKARQNRGNRIAPPLKYPFLIGDDRIIMPHNAQHKVLIVGKTGKSAQLQLTLTVTAVKQYQTGSRSLEQK